MPFVFPDYALWLYCVCPLAFLIIPFGYLDYALWLSLLFKGHNQESQKA
jgi:hypothetical protein